MRRHYIYFSTSHHAYSTLQHNNRFLGSWDLAMQSLVFTQRSLLNIIYNTSYMCDAFTIAAGYQLKKLKKLKAIKHIVLS